MQILEPDWEYEHPELTYEERLEAATRYIAKHYGEQIELGTGYIVAYSYTDSGSDNPSATGPQDKHDEKEE